MPRYTVQELLVSIGRDYDVSGKSGKVAFKLDGKVRFARTFAVKDSAGQRLLAVREKLLCLDPTFVITSARQPIAVVHRSCIGGIPSGRSPPPWLGNHHPAHWVCSVCPLAQLLPSPPNHSLTPRASMSTGVVGTARGEGHQT